MALAAVLAAGLASVPAVAQDCAGCRAAHNACRIQTKGSPACDGQLTACLSGCRRGGGGDPGRGGDRGGGYDRDRGGVHDRGGGGFSGGGRGGHGDHGGPRPRIGGGDRGLR